MLLDEGERERAELRVQRNRQCVFGKREERMMNETFIRGLLAGYGIAIPVGTIAVLIMYAGMRRGFRHGFAAGAGRSDC